jgi:hypothetical protein
MARWWWDARGKKVGDGGGDGGLDGAPTGGEKTAGGVERGRERLVGWGIGAMLPENVNEEERDRKEVGWCVGP